MAELLYDRENELKLLERAFGRAISTQKEKAELVLVTGASGLGKTALVHTLEPVVEGMGGYFIDGKYDQRERPIQYWGIVQSIGEFVQIVKAQPDSFERYQRLIAPLIHNDRLLTDLVPPLEQFASANRTELPASAASGSDAQLVLLFSQLFKAISSVKHPIVMLLDDLQWADHGSLRVLHALVEDPEIQGLMIVGTCRGNEVSLEHRLAVTLREMENDGILLTDIQIHPLEFRAVHRMVEDNFAEDVNRERVAREIWKKSKGNAFFVVQIIRALIDDKVPTERLFYEDSSSSMSVSSVENSLPSQHSAPFSLESEKSRMLGSLDLLASRLDRLPKDQRDVLMIAACMGNQFQEKWISSALPDVKVPGALKKLVEAKYLSEVRGSLYWRFTHDQIQQASYMVIPKVEREAVHLMVGRRLWNSIEDKERVKRGLWEGLDSTKSAESEYLLLVATQLSLGAQLIEETKERVRMARLLVEVSRISVSLSSFRSAIAQLKLAITLLGDRHWRDYYDLSLEVYNASGEVCFYLSDFEGLEYYTAGVIENARHDNDKLRAYTTRIYSLGSQGMLSEATDLAIETLKLYGYKLPSKVSTISILAAFRKTNRILKGYSDADIFLLPKLTDVHMRGVASLMNLLLALSFQCRPRLAPILSCLTVQLTLQHGLAGPTLVSFGSLSLFYCNGLGDPEAGYRYGKLSARLLDSYGAVEWAGRLSGALCNFCLPLKERMRDMLKPLLVSHRLTMSGDIQQALYNAASYCDVGFFGCLPLPKLVEDARTFVRIAQRRQQVASQNLLDPFLQFGLNMTTSEGEDGTFSGSALNAETAVEDALKAKHETWYCLLWGVQLVYASIMGDYRQALHFAELFRKNPPKSPLTMSQGVSICLHSGIAYSETIESAMDPKRGYLKKSLNRLRQYSKTSVNFGNKVLILEGARLASRKNFKGATEKYKESIAGSQAEGLWNDIGLAYELASRSFFRLRDEKSGLSCLKSAARAYYAWGATTKVNKLVEKINALAPSATRRFVIDSHLLSDSVSAGDDANSFDRNAVEIVDFNSNDVLLSRTVFS